MIVHAEDAETIDSAPQPEGSTYESFLRSRPRDAENLAIAAVIERTRRTGGRSHILHLSSSDALGMIAAAKREGLDISVETCPHYLTLTAEEVPDGATDFKCCPPVRERDNRELLWQGLVDRTIDFHRLGPLPLHPRAEGSARRGLRGRVGQGLLPAAGPVADLDRGAPPRIGLGQVVRWMSTQRRSRRSGRQGDLRVGLDADLAVFAEDETYVVDASALHHRHDHPVRGQGALRQGAQDLPAGPPRRSRDPDRHRSARGAA